MQNLDGAERSRTPDLWSAIPRSGGTTAIARHRVREKSRTFAGSRSHRIAANGTPTGTPWAHPPDVSRLAACATRRSCARRPRRIAERAPRRRQTRPTGRLCYRATRYSARPTDTRTGRAGGSGRRSPRRSRDRSARGPSRVYRNVRRDPSADTVGGRLGRRDQSSSALAGSPWGQPSAGLRSRLELRPSVVADRLDLTPSRGALVVSGD